MVDEQVKIATRNRYITAIIFIIIFVSVIHELDKVVNVVVTDYFPTYVVYLGFISAGFNALVGVFGVYIVYRVLLSILDYRDRIREPGQSEVGRLLLRTLFYVAAGMVIFSSFGPLLDLQLSQVLAGGAVGGIIIGLAVQTVVSSILSGFLLSSSRTLVRGDALVLRSGSWGSTDILCKVTQVSTLFTEVVTQNGNVIKLPNTVLFNSATVMKLKIGNSYAYALPVNLQTDVPISKIDKIVKVELRKRFATIGRPMPKFYLNSKDPGTNRYTVMLDFDTFEDVSRCIDAANAAFDEAYWKAKGKK